MTKFICNSCDFSACQKHRVHTCDNFKYNNSNELEQTENPDEDIEECTSLKKINSSEGFQGTSKMKAGAVWKDEQKDKQEENEGSAGCVYPTCNFSSDPNLKKINEKFNN